MKKQELYVLQGFNIKVLNPRNVKVMKLHVTGINFYHNVILILLRRNIKDYMLKMTAQLQEQLHHWLYELCQLQAVKTSTAYYSHIWKAKWRIGKRSFILTSEFSTIKRIPRLKKKIGLTYYLLKWVDFKKWRTKTWSQQTVPNIVSSKEREQEKSGN